MDNVKIAFLFIGAMIGAGFASGSELMVFFGDCSLFTVILSAVIIGILVFCFSSMSVVFDRFKIVGKIIDVVITLSCVITFISMTAGANEIISSTFGVKYFGVVTSVAVAFMSAFSMKWTKNLNTAIVPLIVVLLIMIAVNVDCYDLPEENSVMSAISYASMNVLLGGYMLSGQCRNKKRSSRLIISAIITLVTCAMMIIVYIVAQESKNSVMPIYEVARSYGLATISGIIIYLAIFSTVIGAGKVIFDNVSAFIGDKTFPVAALVVLALLSKDVSFDFMVNSFYPFNGVVGEIIIAVLMGLAAYIYFSGKTGRRKKRLLRAET